MTKKREESGPPAACREEDFDNMPDDAIIECVSRFCAKEQVHLARALEAVEAVLAEEKDRTPKQQLAAVRRRLKQLLDEQAKP